MKTWSIIFAAITLAAFIGLLIGKDWMLFVAIAAGIMTVACLADEAEQREAQEE